MRIVLVNTMMETSKFPSIGFLTPPYWAAILASKIRGRGHEPVLLDLQFQDPKRRVPKIPRKYYEGVDAVFVSGMVQTYPQMIKVSKFYRRRNSNIKIIFGGWGPTSLYHQNGINLSEHILQFCDTALIGEAELVLDELLEDLECGRLNQGKGRFDRFYVADNSKWNNDCWAIPDFTVWDDYSYPFGAIQTQRGCPHGCEFCSVANILGTNVRYKPVEKVREELELLRGRFDLIFFYDDNIIAAGDGEYAERLCETFMPFAKKGMRWFSQCTTRIVCKPKLMDLFEKSGCVLLLFGFESLVPASLKEVHTNKNKLPEKYKTLKDMYKDLLKELTDRKIVVWGCFIYGFKHDQPDIVKCTLEFAMESGVTVFQQTILTPQPGTPLFDECIGKLWYPITPQNWGKYDFMQPTLYRHSKAFTNKQLLEKIAFANKIFYKKTDILSIVRKSRIPKSFLRTSAKAAIIGQIKHLLHIG